MEENVALDSNKQSQFVKSIKGIKNLLKGKRKSGSKKEDKDKVQIGKVKRPRQKRKGLVYLSHIPHGFYEHQMTEYFKQFGVVTNARVIRSKHTGVSKGHAFVEFKDPNVAQIVAETMNNYLMGKRLIKAALVPHEKQRRLAKRKHWNPQNNPGNDMRQKMKKVHNSVKDESQELKIARRLLLNLSKTKQKLRELDIDYDFFTPVDVPEPLINLVEVKKEEDADMSVTKKENKTDVKVKQEGTVQITNKKENAKKSVGNVVKDDDLKSSAVPASKKSKKLTETEKAQANKVNKNTKIPTPEEIVAKQTIEFKESGKALKDKFDSKAKRNKAQEQKVIVLKNAGVKPPENYIQIQNESDDESDSSVDFDSDEYEKTIEQEDSDDLSSDESLDDNITSEEDDSFEKPTTPPKKTKAPLKKNLQAQTSKKQVSKPSPKPMKAMVRNDSKLSKKPKFEKKGKKKTLNKIVKKKK